jgi:hypothetical protein
MGINLNPDLSVAFQMEVRMVLLTLGKSTDDIDQTNTIAKAFELPVAADSCAILGEPPGRQCGNLSGSFV